MQPPRQPTMLDQAEVRLGVACLALVAVLFATAAAHLGNLATYAAALSASCVLGSSLPTRLGALLGGTGWALCTGFVTNRYGLLTFDTPDLALMLAFQALTLGPARAAAARASGGRMVARSPHRREVS